MIRKTDTTPPDTPPVTLPVHTTTNSQLPEPALKERAKTEVTQTPLTVKITPVAKKPVKIAPSKPVVTPPASCKVKKNKLVRDSFAMPKDEYGVIDSLKLRALKIGTPIKKGELLRAGIKAMAAMSDAAFKAALGNVPTLKTGRPKDSK